MLTLDEIAAIEARAKKVLSLNHSLILEPMTHIPALCETLREAIELLDKSTHELPDFGPVYVQCADFLARVTAAGSTPDQSRATES